MNQIMIYDALNSFFLITLLKILIKKKKSIKIRSSINELMIRYKYIEILLINNTIYMIFNINEIPKHHIHAI